MKTSTDPTDIAAVEAAIAEDELMERGPVCEHRPGAVAVVSDSLRHSHCVNCFARIESVGALSAYGDWTEI